MRCVTRTSYFQETNLSSTLTVKNITAKSVTWEVSYLFVPALCSLVTLRLLGYGMHIVITSVFVGDDDYDTLMVRLTELNAANKKREDSFHADRPRKTRGGVKFNAAVDSLKPKSRSQPKAKGTKGMVVKPSSPRDVSF